MSNVITFSWPSSAPSSRLAVTPPDGPREQQPHRRPPGLLRRHHAAARVEQEDARAEPLLERRRVGGDPRAEVGVHERRRRALVLAEPRHERARERHVHARQLLGQDLAGAALVLWVLERPEVGDRDRLDALLAQGRGGGAHVVLAQAADLGAAPVDPLADPEHEPARRERLRHAAERVVGQLGRGQARGHAEHPLHEDRVLEPARRQQRDLGAAALDEGVGRRGRAVRDPLDLAQERVELEPLVGGGLAQVREHALEQVAGRRRRLVGADRTGLVDDDRVRERAADVDPDGVGHLRSRSGTTARR